MAVETVVSTKQKAGRRVRHKRSSRTKAKVHEVNRSHISTLRAAAEHALRQGKRTIGSAHEWTISPGRFARIRLPRRSDFRVIAETNPLFLGAVGLGIGIVLAAVVPGRISTRWKNRTVSGLAQTRQRGRRR
jgi:hypothetical protein